MDKSKTSIGCGCDEHPPDCLCDVIIKEPTQIRVSIPYGIEYGDEIARYGKWDGTLAHWFQLVDFAYSALWKFRNEQPVTDNRGRYARGLPDDVYAFLVQRIREGGQPTPVKNEILDRFGVTIHKSYVTQLRKRMTLRGEL